MRYLVILFVLIPFISNGQVVKEEDEFTGKVSWKSESPKAITVEDGEIIRALYMAIYSEDNWALSLYTVSSSGESIYSNDTVYFLVDGERMQMSVAGRDLDYESGSIISYVVIMPTKEQFYNIGFADEVRVKIGNNVFNMNKEVRSDIRRISRLVSEEMSSN